MEPRFASKKGINVNLETLPETSKDKNEVLEDIRKDCKFADSSNNPAVPAVVGSLRTALCNQHSKINIVVNMINPKEIIEIDQSPAPLTPPKKLDLKRDSFFNEEESSCDESEETDITPVETDNLTEFEMAEIIKSPKKKHVTFIEEIENSPGYFASDQDLEPERRRTAEIATFQSEDLRPYMAFWIDRLEEILAMGEIDDGKSEISAFTTMTTETRFTALTRE